jgi:hypothetical protein
MRRVAALHGGPSVRGHAWRPHGGAHRLRTKALLHRERVTTMDGSKPRCGIAQGTGERRSDGRVAPGVSGTLLSVMRKGHRSGSPLLFSSIFRQRLPSCLKEV